MLIEKLQTLGEGRNIDVRRTTHNPTLLVAAGPAVVLFKTVASRNEKMRFSEPTQLEEIDDTKNVTRQCHR
jgi:hypothetical protein